MSGNFANMIGFVGSLTHSRTCHRRFVSEKSRGGTNEQPYDEFAEMGDLSAHDTPSSASRSVDDDDEATCTWKLTLSDSVYDDALLRPLDARDHENHAGRYMNMLNIACLLLLTLVLQILVLWKIRYVSDEAKAKRSPLIQACAGRPVGFMPFHEAHPGTISTYMDCSPLMVTLMSDVNNLDLDKDGYWNASEAASLGAQWTTKYKKEGNLSSIFWNFMDRAQSGDLLAVKTGGASSAETQDFMRIPMSWMLQQQGEMRLCANFDPTLCGNLEVRGVLTKQFDFLVGRERPKDANQRIRKCIEISEDRCVATFGQLFVWYRHIAHETCGVRHSGWGDTGVVTTRYDNPITYALQAGAISHASYATFLSVIVTIWLLVVLHEGRCILSWWIVLLMFPHTERDDSEVIDRRDDCISVVAIPWHYKILQVVFNLLPRTIVCMVLAYFGCDFLIYADDYSDLILNSVALGFLIDIDNMIFRGVVSERNQSNVTNCEAMSVKLHCNSNAVRLWDCVPQALLLVTTIISFALYLICRSYHMSMGKLDMADAYTCLCHAEGEHCLSAQILGGLPHVPGWAFRGD